MSKMKSLTPDSLFDYVVAFAKAAVEAKSNYLFPTFREACAHFRCRLDDIQDAIDGYQGCGYMREVVGFLCGGGHASIKYRGDYMIEANE